MIPKITEPEPRYCRSQYACKFPLCCYFCPEKDHCRSKCIFSYDGKDGTCDLSMSKEEWTIREILKK